MTARAKLRPCDVPNELRAAFAVRAKRLEQARLKLARLQSIPSSRPSAIAAAREEVDRLDAELRHHVRRCAVEARVRRGERSVEMQPRVEIPDACGGALSLPGGARAAPIWQLGFPVELAGAGARFGAICHELTALGLKAQDLARVRVDGSPVGEGSADRALDLIALRDAAVRSLGSISPIEPVRQMHNDRRKAISAPAVVCAVCVEDQPLLEVLRSHGWGEGGRNKAAVRTILGEALSNIYAAWERRAWRFLK